ncbi:MAG: type 2 isopentenyl-diphosphate Delta-isomerase [Candidatus Diapherotrites archaeon]|nr:type 2 isopentenyl-diphosphate Delta-isomerase [Candidatus Diapherotrites archaeon]
MSTQKRKLSHIEICLNKDVEFKKTATGFEDIEFVHESLPEIDLDKINTSLDFFGKKINLPLMFTAITGGHKDSLKINRTIASVAEKKGIPIGIGSQRAMIEDDSVTYTYAVRDVAPTVPLFGNIGAFQLKEYSKEAITDAISKIGADGLCVHLNPLQEAVQPEGDTNFSGVLDAIKTVCGSGFPVIAKQVGEGISRETAFRLKEEADINGIDVGGSGGTSWTAIEGLRRNDSESLSLFREWGIPTSLSVAECAETNLPVIATGGIRTGLDGAKAIALGATTCGMALPVLHAATKGEKSLEQLVDSFEKTLKIAMYCAGAQDITELQKSKIIITGKLAQQMKARGINPAKYADSRRRVAD